MVYTPTSSRFGNCNHNPWVSDRGEGRTCDHVNRTLTPTREIPSFPDSFKPPYYRDPTPWTEVPPSFRLWGPPQRQGRDRDVDVRRSHPTGGGFSEATVSPRRSGNLWERVGSGVEDGVESPHVLKCQMFPGVYVSE